MKKLFFLLYLLATAFMVRSQAWELLTIPTTNDIVSSSFISDDEGWIGTENSGIYAIIMHTTDNGDSWNTDTITGASGESSYVEFTNSQTGYAVVNGKAFKTSDGGDSWTQLTMPGTPYYEPYFF